MYALKQGFLTFFCAMGPFGEAYGPLLIMILNA
jgi:hypothetical protein